MTLELFAQPAQVPTKTPALTRAPGHRQTVDACVHPTLGEGAVVYGNGPEWFESADGALVPLKWVGSGAGYGKSYLIIVAESGEEMRCDTTGRKKGEVHSRIDAELHGLGWLVFLRDGTSRIRFEADNGHAFEAELSSMWVGKSGDVTARGGRKARIPKEHEDYTTVEFRSGARFTYRTVRS